MDEQLYCGKVVMDSGETWEYARDASRTWVLAQPVLCMLDQEKTADTLSGAAEGFLRILGELTDGRADIIGTATVAQIRETVERHRQGNDAATVVQIGTDKFDAALLLRVCDAALWQPTSRIEFHAEHSELEQPCLMVGPDGVGIVMSFRRDIYAPVPFPMVPA